VHDALPAPTAQWLCAEIGVPKWSNLSPTGERSWTRADFGDDAVTRRGVALSLVGRGWTLSNLSERMEHAYLYDLRYGRRQIAPLGSRRLRRLRSWLLLPSSAGPAAPHVVTIALIPPQGSAAPYRPELPADDRESGRATANVGEPSGKALQEGLKRAEEALANTETRDLLAAYARPYFAISTLRPVPPLHREVATCLYGDEARGERAIQKLRAALWGKADRQPIDTVVALLIRHALLTHDHVRAVRHGAACGHRPEDVDPASYARRRGSP
jgi:hypothetical protein